MLDFSALAQTAVDTKAVLSNPRTSGAAYVPTPLAELIKASKETGTARELPLPSAGVGNDLGFSKDDDRYDPKDKVRAPGPATVEYNEILKTLRRDATFLQIGLRTKPLFYVDDEENEYLGGIEFQGKNLRAPRKPKPTEETPAEPMDE